MSEAQSAPARSGEAPSALLSYQFEPWSVYESEAPPLWEEHYREVGTSDPMDIDAPFYRALEASGQLQILTARRAGHMIGYIVVLVRRHPHYAILCGFEDGYFVTKRERKFGVGRDLFMKTMDELRRRGAKKVVFHSKLFAPHRKLFESLGCTHLDELWIRTL